jgi:hypothetical protein
MDGFRILFSAIPGVVLATVIAGALSADVGVKKVRLEWHDIAQSDGGSMYSGLCAACHGAGGKGNGPAASGLDRVVPDLTVLSVNNGGTYPHQYVADTIFGGSRSVSHRTLDMPNWGEQFMYVGRGWHSFPRRKLANDRVEALTDHIAGLQVADVR